DILPGYLPMPSYEPSEANDLAAYIRKHRSPKGWWDNIDKYIVSLLKAYYGDAATPANDFGFGWLPRLTGDHSHFGYWMDMAGGKLGRTFVYGTETAGAAPQRARE